MTYYLSLDAQQLYGKCIQSVLTANIMYLCIIIFIQILWDLSASELLLYLSEQQMTQAHGVSLHFTSNLWPTDLSASVWHVLRNFITFPFPALSPRISRHTTVNLHNLDHVQMVCAKCNAVGCMDWSSMTAVICLGSPCTLTAPPMTRMSSLTSILLVNFISSLGDAFSLNRTRQDNIQFVGWISICEGVCNFCILCTTFPHALMNDHTAYCYQRFRVRVGTGTEPWQWVLPHENPDHGNGAGFTTNNLGFQLHDYGSN